MIRKEFSQKLKEKAQSLPLSPGIYIMKDTSGKIIYVGKSKKLRNRVSQYFNETNFHSPKTDAMTHNIADFEYILCNNEIEALSLENNLIKLHKPKYNIKLKDDKSYPYIAVNLNDDYPRYIMTRDRTKKEYTYFGPYSGISTAFDIIKAVNRTFSLPSCRYAFPKDKGKIKHCIYMQMGCIAPCKESVTKEEYAERFKSSLSFFSGNRSELIKNLTEEMMKASDSQQYELAAVYRNQILSIKKLDDKQKVVADPGTDKDIIGFYDNGNVSCICSLYIRDGKLSDSDYTYFSGGEIIESGDIVAYLANQYSGRLYIPKEIVLPNIVNEDDMNLLKEWLSSSKNIKINPVVPKKGVKEKLVELAIENAKQKCLEYKVRETNYEKATVAIARLAGLEVIPDIIEAFDISNLGNENIKAGLVVFKGGKPLKSAYRIFNIKSTDVQNDYASMKEAVQRHLNDLREGKSIMPDLILIDGGVGHVSSVNEVMVNNNSDIPFLGMVKNEKHVTRALVSNEGIIDISKEKELYSLLYKIQEEVHRFTVSGMMNKKLKSMKTSSLEQISGIGKQKAALLLDKFGGLDNIKNSSVEELMKVKGINADLAENIIKFLNEEKK